MNKRKQNVDGTAPARPKLREFPNWPFEQVMEVARMLYALRPFKFDQFRGTANQGYCGTS
jgi:hypothetical protein